MSTTGVKVAIGSDFLTAFARLPGRQQSKVSQFLEKFRSNPMAPGINYEKIQVAKDPNLHSVRIDQTYRGIVLKPPRGDVYLLLWVDQHDDAYAWAAKRRFAINAHTGSLQIVPTDDVEAIDQPPRPWLPEPTGLFKHVKDKHLLKLGVPDELLPLVRQIESDADLEANESTFPQEAVEALYMLAMGYSVDQTFNEVNKDIEKEVAVDPDDFETALENEDTQRCFHVVTDALDLAEILKAPLEKWRVFLHPSQRRLVQMQANGPVRVLGGAGTGKTVVAMHRAKYLAEHVFTQPTDKILFTTYTRNLAQDIDANLSKLCSVDVKRRIRVVNLDAWVSEFLKRHGYDYRLLVPFDQATAYWQEAMLVAPDDLDFLPSFYAQEWEHVIQANGISREREYLRASRLGRGQRLSRQQRQAIWPVFEEYRAILNRHHMKEFVDAIRDARILLESRGNPPEYRAVVVDEAQDMSAEAFKLIRQIVPPEVGGQNDLFIVGDAHQRIYAHRVVLGRCGIDIRGRSRKLRLNYRTTDEIRKWAVALLEDRDIDDLDGGKDDNRGYRALLHGDFPEVQTFPTFEAEVSCISTRIGQLKQEDIPLSSICVVARTQGLLEQYESSLSAKEIEYIRIQHQVSDDPNKPGLRTATMHRVKGLEFDAMIIVGVNDGVVPLAFAASHVDSDYARMEFETKERSLLYVATTRAKSHVLITCSGKPSPFIR